MRKSVSNIFCLEQFKEKVMSDNYRRNGRPRQDGRYKWNANRNRDNHNRFSNFDDEQPQTHRKGVKDRSRNKKSVSPYPPLNTLFCSKKFKIF